MLRGHQKRFEFVIDDIIKGHMIDEIDVVATPGAGKSSLPIQATRLISAGLADAVGWIVPRSALQSQGERGFIDPFFRNMFHHEYLIRSSTNDVNPCRGTNGFVTTYQAISIDKQNTVLREIKSKRYILFLDEFHHLEKDGVWHESLKEIIDSCKYLVKMTGTLGRGDKKPIAYINYEGTLPQFEEGRGSRLITYPRTEALKEKAILPIKFYLNDGRFSWKDKDGNFRSIESFKNVASGKEQTGALFTALNSEFFDSLLTQTVDHWKKWKQSRRTAKLLVVTSDLVGAERALDVLRGIGIRSEIATSHESVKAQKHINMFKGTILDCLVTIAMAYEGLDVPEISHIGVLTNIRSREWIEQCLARGVRIDKNSGLPYEAQLCHVFAPEDKNLSKVVRIIKNEQLSAIEYFSEIAKKKEDDFEEKEFEQGDLFQAEITPISGDMTKQNEFMLSGEDILENSLHKMPVLTIKEQEIELRRQIHKHINIFCINNRYKQAKINSEIKERFGRKRDLMPLDELERLSKYIVKYYPIDGTVITYTRGVSPVRSKRKVVSNKVTKWTSCSDILKKMNYNPMDRR